MKLRLSAAWLRSRAAKKARAEVTTGILYGVYGELHRRIVLLSATISELKRRNRDLEQENVELGKYKADLEWMKRKEDGWL